MFFVESIVSPIIGALGPAIVIGWIAGRSGNSTAIAYVFLGASLSMIWNTGIFRTGRSLANEHILGTLDLLMTTRTPLAVLMFGKALAVICFGAINGAATFAVVLAFAGHAPSIANVAFFLARGRHGAARRGGVELLLRAVLLPGRRTRRLLQRNHAVRRRG